MEVVGPLLGVGIFLGPTAVAVWDVYRQPSAAFDAAHLNQALVAFLVFMFNIFGVIYWFAVLRPQVAGKKRSRR